MIDNLEMSFLAVHMNMICPEKKTLHTSEDYSSRMESIFKIRSISLKAYQS